MHGRTRYQFGIYPWNVSMPLTNLIMKPIALSLKQLLAALSYMLHYFRAQKLKYLEDDVNELQKEGQQESEVRHGGDLSPFVWHVP